MKWIWIIFIALVLIGIVSWKFSRFGYATAGYTVIEKDGPFEIRKYKALTLVSTSMKHSQRSDDRAFMRLFGYIAKENADDQKIAMTTPVFTTADEMSFVVPEDVTAPAPKSDQISLKQVSMGKVAAYRYSGRWNSEKRKEGQRKLGEWLHQRSESPAGDFFNAGYDPPFTPGFMKRNEALVQISD